MAGQGKYTTYVPVASVRNTRLGRLFAGNSTISNPLAEHVASGNADKAREETVDRAKALLQPSSQQGDLGHFPQGVRLDYQHENFPDVTKVAWESAGDPANPYMPDPSSPGPGETSPLAKDSDPEISPTDVKGEGYIPGQPGVSTTRNPLDTAPAVHAENELGKAGTLGKNSVNEPSGF